MSSIKVEGMSCSHCTNAIKEAMQKEKNVGEVVVDLEKKLVSWSGGLEISAVKKIVEDQGFVAVLD